MIISEAFLDVVCSDGSSSADVAVSRGANFVLGEHVIDFCTCCDNVVLSISRGGGVRSVSAHVSFVGGGEAR